MMTGEGDGVDGALRWIMHGDQGCVRVSEFWLFCIE